MKKWELAFYFIEAKKSIDSMMFIKYHRTALSKVGMRDRIQTLLRNFYINCRTVIDKTFSKKEKLELKKTDEVLKAILFEADKNYAHKDDEYKPNKYETLSEWIDTLKTQIRHIRVLCKHALPEKLTVNFVPHDRELYRLVNGITAEKEEELLKSKHPQYGQQDGAPIGEPRRVFHSVEQTKEENVNPEKYAVILEAGLNSYEGLQNRQDGSIKYNVLFDQNMWAPMNLNIYIIFEEIMLKWVYEGDFILWVKLAFNFCDEQLPYSEEMFLQKFNLIFNSVCNCKLGSEKVTNVIFDSKTPGQVSHEFWKNSVLPILLLRLEMLNEVATDIY